MKAASSIARVRRGQPLARAARQTGGSAAPAAEPTAPGRAGRVVATVVVGRTLQLTDVGAGQVEREHGSFFLRPCEPLTFDSMVSTPHRAIFFPLKGSEPWTTSTG